MKTTITIRKNAQTPTGYEVVNGDGTILAIESTYKGEPNTLMLPTNTANRKYCNSKKVDEAPNGELTLEYKATQHYTSGSTHKSWEDWLTDDDKTVLAELKARAEANKKAAKDSEAKAKNDPLLKAQKEMEKWQKKVDELKAKASK